MCISISIPINLARSVAKGKSLFQVNGTTLEEGLKNLCQSLPQIQKKIFYADGYTLQSSIKILLNNRPVDIKDSSIKLKEGDRVQIKREIR